MNFYRRISACLLFINHHRHSKDFKQAMDEFKKNTKTYTHEEIKKA